MKLEHQAEWNDWVNRFLELRGEGYPYKKIMWEFRRLFSWSVIRREIFPNDPLLFGEIQIRDYEPKDFRLEDTTLWRFTRRGAWATHTNHFPGNWPPQVPRNLILRSSKAGDVVLDPFLGGGTTMIEALLLGRHGIGVDISPSSVKVAQGRIDGLRKAARKQHYPLPKVKLVLTVGDARNLDFVPEGSIDLVCAHPPYLDSIKYSKWIHDDLSRIADPSAFIGEFEKVADEMRRVLKPGGRCTLMVGDLRKEGRYVPLGIMLLELFRKKGFRLEDLIVKEQEHASHDEFYLNKSFLRISHEYLFVLTNVSPAISRRNTY